MAGEDDKVLIGEAELAEWIVDAGIKARGDENDIRLEAVERRQDTSVNAAPRVLMPVRAGKGRLSVQPLPLPLPVSSAWPVKG
jgi:hypothetical protein